MVPEWMGRTDCFSNTRKPDGARLASEVRHGKEAIGDATIALDFVKLATMSLTPWATVFGF